MCSISMRLMTSAAAKQLQNLRAASGWHRERSTHQLFIIAIVKIGNEQHLAMDPVLEHSLHLIVLHDFHCVSLPSFSPTSALQHSHSTNQRYLLMNLDRRDHVSYQTPGVLSRTLLKSNPDLVMQVPSSTNACLLH